MTLYKQKHLSPKFLLQLPILKPLYLQQQLLHFTQSLTLCLQAGLPIRQALMLSCPSNDPLRADTLHCIQHIELGHSLHQSMQDCISFPDLLLHMIELGEQTGNLDTMFEHFSQHLNQSLATRLKQLTQLIEPVIILVLGILIGGLIISIYLPIFKLGSTL